MKFYKDDAALRRIAHGVRDRTLPRPEWSHGAHFAAALWYLYAEPDPPAQERLPQLIRAYNAASGTPNTDTTGYHETITQASLRAAEALKQTLPTDTALHEVHDRLMDSPLGDPRWLLEYWTRERLFSPEARRAWVPSDLKPFPY